MRTAYSYIRFSTPEQMKGDSQRRQLEATRRYCEAHHLKLDESFRDLGISAFRGKNKETGSLGRFLKAVEDGKIAQGAVLIVESLDRISRQLVLDALNTFTSIIRAGVEVVTLMDSKAYTTKSINDNPMDLMASILVMMRAHEESATKAKRVSAAWDEKRKHAATRPMSGRCPGWLQLDKATGKFVLIPQKAAVIRRMVELAMSGMGPVSIAAKLNKEKVAKFGRHGKAWEYSTVNRILTEKMLMGEYQPCRMVDGKRVPVGEPVKDYYPAVVTEAEYYALQSVMDSRRVGSRGRTGKTIANLFGRLLVCGDDGGTVKLAQKRKANLNMVSGNAVRGLGEYVSFPYRVWEEHFLSWVKEVELNGHEVTASRIPELTARLTEAEGKAAAIKAKIDSSKDGRFDVLLDLYTEALSAVAAAKAELEQERKAHARPAVNGNAFALIEKMKELEGEELLELRSRIRASLQAVVENIRVWIRRDGMRRAIVARVHLKDGMVRVFGIRKDEHKGAVPYSVSCDTLWKPEQVDDNEFPQVADAMLAAEEKEEVEAAITMI